MTVRSRALVALAALALLAPSSATASPDRSPETASTGAGSPRSAAVARDDAPPVRVLAVSVDALNPTAMRRLGREAVPHLWRLVDEGAATLNARAQYELTLTLPNHTSMVTGRRVAKRAGGHGVTWNTERPRSTVHRAAGERVRSVFTEVAAAGGSTALFSTKAKFRTFTRSWPRAIDRTVIRVGDDDALVGAARADLVTHDRALTFVHLGVADAAGHAHGFMSPDYLRAVEHADDLVGTLLTAIDTEPTLDDVVVVLTADHGGVGRDHAQADQLGDYRIPFMVWGPGVEHGDLYDMNPTYVDPGRSRPRPVGRQPVRNSDLANLVTTLLGMGAVPGSQFDVRQRLRVTGGG
ncbi:alkaline phosphatase family protein [Nocardioides lijunqiniae]|uniref:alkaline phosphatase family protein n=1 Tax=Nocardioides lijunqiniae TaxID=2760832 RepID=UPI001878189E|nr:alkaline phosphatase family protein [Nocardioides lijunqiniae]